MPEAYIVDATRTAVGRRKGGFAQSHPADMAAHVIKTLVERNSFDPAAIDDVILGCLDNIGSQAGDIARTAAALAYGFHRAENRTLAVFEVADAIKPSSTEAVRHLVSLGLSTCTTRLAPTGLSGETM